MCVCLLLLLYYVYPFPIKQGSIKEMESACYWLQKLFQEGSSSHHRSDFGNDDDESGGEEDIITIASRAAEYSSKYIYTPLVLQCLEAVDENYEKVKKRNPLLKIQTWQFFFFNQFFSLNSSLYPPRVL